MSMIPTSTPFVPASVLDRLATLTRAEADAQPFGVIKLDDAGIIQLYNRYESELAGVSTAQAEGANFFTQIAPCTNNRLFFGKFKAAVAAGAMDLHFPYTFTYKMKATNVQVHMHRTTTGQPTNWIFIHRN